MGISFQSREHSWTARSGLFGTTLSGRYPGAMGENQAATVLRHGQRVRLEDATGVIYVSEVTSVAGKSLVLRLLDEAPEDAFPTGATAFVGVAGPSGLSRLKAVVDLR